MNTTVNTFTGFPAFLGKELLQALRSWRALVIVLVFVLLGVMNAPLAWSTPMLLDYMGSTTGIDPSTLGTAIPDATALEAWGQYFSNVGQMGLLTILLVCGSALSGERSKGTLILPLTKGLGRSGIVVAKFLVSSALWTAGILIASATSQLATIILFPNQPLEYLLEAIAALWLLGEFLLALIPLSSLLVRGSFAGLILPGAVLFVGLILSAFPRIFFFNPILLATNGIAVMAGAQPVEELLAPLICALVLAVAALVSALFWFRKTEL